MRIIQFLILLFNSQLYIQMLDDPYERNTSKDTLSINNLIVELLGLARSNPNLAMQMAYGVKHNSFEIHYPKGVVDASLVLGIAWLAKYNEKDSALFYNLKALTLYDSLNDILGMARACFGLSYVFSFKDKFFESEQYALRSKVLFEQSGDTRGIINSYNALAYLAESSLTETTLVTQNS